MFKFGNYVLLSITIYLGFSAHIYANSASIQNLRNVITVSHSGADFTSLEDAIGSIDNASEINPYLILIGPGRYKIRERIEMKRWVSISGSGKNITRLQGATGIDTRSLFRGVEDSQISDLEIRMGMNSTNRSSTALSNWGGRCTSLKNVLINIRASSGIHPRAIWSATGCSSFELDGVDIFVHRSRGGLTTGLVAIDDNFTLRNSRILATIAIESGGNDFTVKNSEIVGEIRTRDGGPNQSGRFYDSVIQSPFSEVIATQQTPLNTPFTLSFTRCSFITPNGLPEFGGDSAVSCTLSDNSKGLLLNSSCEVQGL